MPITSAKYRALKQSKLEKKANPGTIIYACEMPDYGCASLASKQHGIKHRSFTLKPDGDYPFFTMPLCDVEPVD
jgi:hypothetical protein